MTFQKKTMDELQRLSKEEAQAAPKFPVVLVLDQVRSMQNVGSAFRTADAFGVQSIYLCGYTPTPPHRDINKSALGATETVHWQHFEKTTDAIAQLKNEGYHILSIEQAHNSISLFDYSFPEKCAFIFGNEVEGVSNEALAISDVCIEIPQAGSKHSMNITVSLGVVLWEKLRAAL